MVLEYMNGGNLFKYMSRNRKMPKELVKRIFAQTVHAIKYIHQEGYMLRDLKPENILLDQQQNIKGKFINISDVWASYKNPN